MNIKLNGNDREVQAGSAFDMLKALGGGMYKTACAVKIGGKVCDLRTPLCEGDNVEVLTFDEEEGKKVYWHTSSHILAQAVLRLFPDAKFAIGPAVENGFYYDFDLSRTLTPEDIVDIEAEMKKIIKENIPIERFELAVDQANKTMGDLGQTYKLELIAEHADKGENISFYKQGDYIDLCAGPHLMSTGSVKAIKVTACTAAYWRGDANNKMLQRVYGVSFPKAAALEEHLAKIEEAKKRDHNVLGRQLGYFTTSELIGQGLPLLMPNGARVLQLLQRFVEDEEQKRGWQLTKTPLFAKSDLYKVSGHWDHYQDGMFVMGEEGKDDEVFALRPMTCPFQYQIYLNKQRSYRDLPLRYNETSTLFRNEASGEMHGLIRVRQFTISEGHLMCTPDQLEQEFKDCLDLAIYMLKTLGLYEDASYRFSLWDPNNTDKYIGTAQEWNKVQDQMRSILNDLGVDFVEGVGEAAFYGPKLDIQLKNVHGKEDTLITIQIDPYLAKQFEMEYVDADGTKKHPFIIHRTSIGCYERTLALLIEKYAGALPMWLMPTQVKVLPISDRHHEYAQEVASKLADAGLRVECDTRSEKTGYKIREAQLQKTPYMLIVGDAEQEAGAVAVRSRKNGDEGTMSTDEFLSKALLQVATKAKDQ